MTTRETTRTDDRGEERRSRGPEEKNPSANSFASSSRDGAFDVTSRKLMNHRNLKEKDRLARPDVQIVRSQTSGRARALGHFASRVCRDERAPWRPSAIPGASTWRRSSSATKSWPARRTGARARSLGVDATRAIDVGKQTGSPLAVPARGRLNLSDRRDPLAPLAPSRLPPPPDPQARDPARCGGG